MYLRTAVCTVSIIKKKKKGVITEGFHAYFIPEHLLRCLKRRRKKKRAAIIIIILISINI